jgi:hypothetical protein
MSRPYLALLFGTAALSLVACGNDSSSSPTPPVAATPTPSPTATPANPMARVAAEWYSFTRAFSCNCGAFSNPRRYPLPPWPDFFITGDAIDIGCTPRDADGVPTSNHPMAIEWYYTSGGQGVLVADVDYVFDHDDTFNPQIQIRSNTRDGWLETWCKVGGIESNHLHVEVRYVDPNR